MAQFQAQRKQEALQGKKEAGVTKKHMQRRLKERNARTTIQWLKQKIHNPYPVADKNELIRGGIPQKVNYGIISWDTKSTNLMAI